MNTETQVFAAHTYSDAYGYDVDVAFYQAKSPADAWKHLLQHYHGDAYELIDVSDTKMTATDEGLIFVGPEKIINVMSKYGDANGSTVCLSYDAVHQHLNDMRWDLVNAGLTDDPFPSWEVRMIPLDPDTKFLVWRNTSNIQDYYCSKSKVTTNWGDDKGDGDLSEFSFEVKDVIEV